MDGSSTNFLLRVTCVFSLLTAAIPSVLCNELQGKTEIHGNGYCAMFDRCGSNDAGEVPCADNRPAETVDDDLAALMAEYCPYLWNQISQRRQSCCNANVVTDTYESMQRAVQFFSGCPACLNNFFNLWCTISCSPDQATFTDVIQTRIDAATNKTAVEEVHFYFADVFKQSLFNSCKEVKFSSTNLPVLTYMGNPSTADDFLHFLGLSYEDGGEAPYSLMFPSEGDTPAQMTPYNETLPSCGSPGFECSCADCSEASYCKAIAGEKHSDSSDACSGPLRCYEYAILAAGLIGLAFVTWLIYFSSYERRMHDIGLAEHTSVDSYEPVSDTNEFRAVLLEGEAVVYPAVETWLRDHFRLLGMFVAERPGSIIIATLTIVALMALGNINYSLESTPQGLWTPKGSRTVKDKDKYESSFGPFYRVENLILATTPETPSPAKSANGLPRIVTYDNMDLMFRIHDVVDSVEGHVEEDDRSYVVTLEDVCYKPLGVCVIESVLQYWQMDRSNWEEHFKHEKKRKFDSIANQTADACFQQWTTQCHSTFGAPIDPKIVLGGFPTDHTFRSHVNDTTAFTMTYLLDSSEENRKAAMAWEKALLNVSNTVIKDMAKEAQLEISFLTERSTEDELKRETYMDALTIVLSYLVMFVYIAISLTFLTKRHAGVSQNVFVRSHVVLGLEGVSIVVLSVLGAFGLISMLGMKVSLIVLEVLPFLVLAVGVDNMFILANELRSFEPVLPLSLRLGSALAEVGPSITCAALSEGLAFGLAALAPIPAARSFSLCACFAILLGFFLQCTLFTSLLVLDTRRRESNRVDCVPCYQLEETPDSDEPEYVVWDSGTPPQESPEPVPENPLQRAISHYMPFLLGAERKVVRWAVLSLTVVAFVTSCVLLGRMELGMEEQVAFPRDSYLQEYFTDGLPLMRVGAPVMFVVEDLDVSSAAEDTNKVCGVAQCSPDSLVSQIDLAAGSGAHHLASPAASWIDDFLMWLRTPKCCRTRGDTREHCLYDSTDPSCVPCSVHLSEADNIYQKHLPGFMHSIPNVTCPRGGRGAYEDFIQHAKGNSSDVTGLDEQRVQASAFRSYYRTLVEQNDYIEALRETHDFVDALKESTGLEIYAYSVFHVFFQQYLNLVPTAAMMISGAVAAVFVVCWILLSSFRAALIVMACVTMVVVDLVGASFLAEVKLNGVSVVNLTMSVGIAVEFCVHLAHAFLVMPGSRVGRVSAAFQGVGISVVSGIAVTKFLGVVVLAFAETKLFQIYYFRMYMALVLLCAWHGLIVLPVLLALFGPPPPVVRITRPPSNDT